MKWVKLHEKAQIPTRATEHAAGYDLYADKDMRIEPGEVVIIPTGITFEGLEPNQFIQISLRSGISLKRPFLMANGVGIIDADYAGKQIGVILYNRSDRPAVVDRGERIAQAIILQYYTAENEKKPTTKRKGGYGSTGEK